MRRMNTLGVVSWRRCMVEKVWSFHIWPTAESRKPEFISKCTAILIYDNSGLLVSTQTYLSIIHDREMRSTNIHRHGSAILQYLSGYLPPMVSKNEERGLWLLIAFP